MNEASRARLLTAAATLSALFMSASLFGHIVALRLLLLLAAAAMAAAAAVRNRDCVQLLPPIWIAFALWAAWALLSLTWSIEPARTLKELRNEVGYTTLALWACFIGAQARDAARLMAPIFAGGALLACAIALYKFNLDYRLYIEGWHGGPGDHSSALLVLMPCAAMAGWYAARTRLPPLARAMPLALMALFAASAYTTLNRTIWLGFAAQFMLLGILLWRRHRSVHELRMTVRHKLLAGVLILALLGALAAAFVKVQAQRQAIGAGLALERDTRFALWPLIIERIQERPLTGYGFGRGLLREALGERLRSLDAHLWHAHNYFLEALLQTGLPGLALILVLLGAIVRAGWRLAGDRSDAAAACGIALLGVVTGMLVRNMTDSLLVRQNALLYWAAVGTLLGAGVTLRSRQAVAESRPL